MKYAIGMVALAACISGCGHSTKCYNISDREAAAAASRALEQLLRASSPKTGIPVSKASEMSVVKTERFTGEKGSGYFNVKVTFKRRGTPGRLVAFVYEDCAVEWSPQFENQIAPTPAHN